MITIIVITHNSQCICLINKMFAGTTFARTGQAYDNKSGQWLGSLVASSGEDGTVMVGTTTMAMLGVGFSSLLQISYVTITGVCPEICLVLKRFIQT